MRSKRLFSVFLMGLLLNATGLWAEVSVSSKPLATPFPAVRETTHAKTLKVKLPDEKRKGSRGNPVKGSVHPRKKAARPTDNPNVGLKR